MYMQKNRHDQTGHCDAPTLNSSSECKVIRFVSRTKLTVFRLRSVCASNLSSIHLMALNHNICLLSVVLSVCDSPFIPIQFNRLAQQPTTYPFKQTDTGRSSLWICHSDQLLFQGDHCDDINFCRTGHAGIPHNLRQANISYMISIMVNQCRAIILTKQT